MANADGRISFSFGHGMVESRDRVRVICEIELEGGRQPAIARWDGAGQKWSILPMPWMAVRLAIVRDPRPCVFALCGDGTVGLGYGGYSEESINPSVTGPKGRGPLRALRVIGKHLYAAGMGRQVYRRMPDGSWLAIDPDRVPALGEIDICGFTSLDGVDDDDFWGVGFKGEIWRRHLGNWEQFASPTNLTLHVIRMISSHLGYAAGNRGVVLRYVHGSWGDFAQLPGVEDVWGLEMFQGKLYGASTKGIYVFDEVGNFTALSPPGLSSFGHLHAEDGVLWSFGTLQLAWTYDGKSWTEEKLVV